MRLARPQLQHLGVIALAVVACLTGRPALGDQRASAASVRTVAVRTPVAAPRDRPSTMVPTYRPWLDPRVHIATPERPGIAQLLDVRCDACASSAAGAEAGETTIQSALDLQALTIIQIGGATVKLTSLQPFSLLFKQHF